MPNFLYTFKLKFLPFDIHICASVSVFHIINVVQFQEIVGGMLDLETNLWRKPRKENFDQQRRKVMEFSGWYKEFDPTQDN